MAMEKGLLFNIINHNLFHKTCATTPLQVMLQELRSVFTYVTPGHETHDLPFPSRRGPRNLGEGNLE